MRNLLFVATLALVTLFTSCNSNKKAENNVNYDGHKFEVKEVLQANAYTYILAKENKDEYWIAVPKMMVETGETLYYKKGMEMTNFQSKDLNRVFPSVYFVEKVTREPEVSANQMMENHKEAAKEITKKEIKVEAVEGGITVGDLYTTPGDYENKTIVVKGEVVKANFGIMGKNWYHIQDGTEGNGKFDLTVTSLAADLKVGDVVAFEGVIALNKDFGHGYNYDVLMEDAVVK